MTTLNEPLVENYLRDVSDALRAADPERRNEILEQIEDHILSASADLAPGDDAGLRTVLERLGPPADIATAAGVSPYDAPAAPPVTAAPSAPTSPPAPTGTAERWALVAFALSPILCLVGWVVGVVLLWTSRMWTTRHKVVGTVATLPFALLIVLSGLVFTVSARTASSGPTVSVAAVEAPTSLGTATPTTTLDRSEPAATTPPEAIVTDTSDDPGWTAGRVLAVAGWAVVLLLLPIATIVWLGRALVLHRRANSVPAP
ncbi:MAG: hypothetical protein U0Q22_14140 [Acidimicrobiales bacterium]